MKKKMLRRHAEYHGERAVVWASHRDNFNDAFPGNTAVFSDNIRNVCFLITNFDKPFVS